MFDLMPRIVYYARFRDGRWRWVRPLNMRPSDFWLKVDLITGRQVMGAHALLVICCATECMEKCQRCDCRVEEITHNRASQFIFDFNPKRDSARELLKAWDTINEVETRHGVGINSADSRAIEHLVFLWVCRVILRFFPASVEAEAIWGDLEKIGVSLDEFEELYQVTKQQAKEEEKAA
jgi:hypothetical protein